MFVRKSKVMKMFTDMVRNRDKAIENNEYAKAVTQGYVDRFESGVSRFASRIDAERASVEDNRRVDAIANNQMYDRFAMRDAAALSALLKMTEMGLLSIVEDRDLNDINTPDHIQEFFSALPRNQQ
jgi:hypothetical protein